MQLNKIIFAMAMIAIGAYSVPLSDVNSVSNQKSGKLGKLVDIHSGGGGSAKLGPEKRENADAHEERPDAKKGDKEDTVSLSGGGRGSVDIKKRPDVDQGYEGAGAKKRDPSMDETDDSGDD